MARISDSGPTSACGVNTPMIMNDMVSSYIDANPAFAAAVPNRLPVDFVEPIDISNAVCWLWRMRSTENSLAL